MSEPTRYTFLRGLRGRVLRGKIIRAGVWFVDIPRTSSTSIRTELAGRFGRPYAKGNILNFKGETGRRNTGGPFWDHLIAEEMVRFLGRKDWDRLFTFSLVRNPWDRMVSLWYYRMGQRQLPSGQTFRDYVLRLREPLRNADRHSPFARSAYHYGCHEYLFSATGEKLVRFVGRYEEREAFLRDVGLKLGFEGLGKLYLQRAKPERRHYSSYYDQETMALVADMYAKDIKEFQYRFEAQ